MEHLTELAFPPRGRTMTAMSIVSDRPAPPAPVCAPNQVGPCRGCQHPTCRYGPGGNPLCVLCTRALEEWRARGGNGTAGRS